MRAGIREERLRVTAALKRPGSMSSWLGLSGRRYVVGIHGLDEADDVDLDDAVIIAVRRERDGEASVVDVTAPGLAAGRGSRLRWLVAMRVRGASEMHVHLLAESEAERRAILRDLAGDAELNADQPRG